MTPSERINHIRDIARELEAEDWTLIDLTLKEFTLPWKDQWSGSKKSYVVDMISGAADGTLLDLAKHLGVASELESINPPAFWNEGDARIFISHVSSIKAKATGLREALDKYGVVSFVAHEDIEPTKEWMDEIEAALATMDALVALLSPGFNESKWCDQEVGVAIGRRIPIVPIKIDLDPYGFFGKYQAIQAKGKNPLEVSPLIFRALVDKPQTGPKMTSCLVNSLRKSKSWDASRRLIGLIEQSKYITKEHVSIMKQAIDENSEVGDAWSVPEKIGELEKRYGS